MEQPDQRIKDFCLRIAEWLKKRECEQPNTEQCEQPKYKIPCIKINPPPSKKEARHTNREIRNDLHKKLEALITELESALQYQNSIKERTAEITNVLTQLQTVSSQCTNPK